MIFSINFRATNQMGEALTSTKIDVISKSSQQLREIQPKEDLMDFEKIDPPHITIVSKHVTGLREGESAHIEASLTPIDDSTMNVEWLFNGEPLAVSNRIHTIHSFGCVILEIFNLRTEDSGTYTCVATNECGTDQISFQLECNEFEGGERPHFITQMQSMLGMKEGQSIHLESKLEPVGDPNMRVDWYRNGQPLQPSSRIKLLNDFGIVVIDISYLHSEDSGEYVCVASNKYGSDTTRFTVECSPSSKIVRQSILPQSMQQIHALEGHPIVGTSSQITPTASQSPKFLSQLKELIQINEGQSAHFESQLVPINDPEMTVDWFLNGAPLKSGQRFREFNDFGVVVLDIIDCDENDSGVYECKANNSFGTDAIRTTLKCKRKYF